MELTDADLIARVLVDDDQHAFGELVRRHQSTVRGLLRQLTRTDVALADDLAQETFLRAYKNIRSFRGEARFSTWLYRIAYNCFREDARRRKELVGIDEDQLDAAHDPQVADPALRHDLMHALSLLPLHERTAVLLCCQTGLSHDEAARVLDIPLGTVKTNVLRGREKLKKPWRRGREDMDDQITDDSLDRQLREIAPYIEDNGFTAGVLAKLPSPRRRHESLRSIILIGLTALSSAAAYTLPDGGRFIAFEMARLTALPTLYLCALAVGSGVLVMTGGIVAAMSKMNEGQS